MITFETGEIFEDRVLVVDVGRYATPDDRGKYVVVYRRKPDGSLRLLVDSASDGTGNEPPAQVQSTVTISIGSDVPRRVTVRGSETG